LEVPRVDTASSNGLAASWRTTGEPLEPIPEPPGFVDRTLLGLRLWRLAPPPRPEADRPLWLMAGALYSVLALIVVSVIGLCVLVEVRDLGEHLLELSCLLADLDHLADHRREDRVLDQRLRDRHALVDLLAHAREGLLDHPVACGLAGDLERLDDVHACRDERRERAREPRHRHLEDDVADLHRQAQLQLVPVLPPRLRPLVSLDAVDRPEHAREDDVPP